ncbi:MAG TPA: alpha/beta hydrolase [Polyangiaceae bacterium]|nr:alpha/beta hydrolase [Polyangiaceae bacterium]
MIVASEDFAPLPDGGRLAHEIRGPERAPPILLLRPLGGSLASWGVFADALATRLRVIAFDARGTGQSSAAPLATSTRSMSKDALALLDALGIERAHAYGISLGGMVATWLAIDAPARVARLVLASTLPRGTMLRSGAALRALSVARCLARPPPEAESCLATRVLSREFQRTHPVEVARIRALAARRPASHRALLTLLAAAARHDATARLGDVRADTLLIAGERDRLIAGGSQRRMLARIPRARLEIAPGAGHDVSAEAPEWVAARVLSHVSAE